MSKSIVHLAYARDVPDDYVPSWPTRIVTSLLTLVATLCAVRFAVLLVANPDPTRHATSPTSYAVLFAILGMLWALGRSPLMLKWNLAVLIFISFGWGLLRAEMLD